MKDFETVEMLSKKANVTLEQAKNALDRSEWDVLEAQKILDQEAAATNSQILSDAVVPQSGASDNTQSVSLSRLFGRFCGCAKKLIKKGMANDFIVNKGERNVVKMPVLVFVLLLILFTFPVIPIMIVGLFFGYGYSFGIGGFTGSALNGAMKKVANVTEQMKNDFKAGVDSTNC